jgi:hypothetical protein
MIETPEDSACRSALAEIREELLQVFATMRSTESLHRSGLEKQLCVSNPKCTEIMWS